MSHLDHWRRYLAASPIDWEPSVLGIHTVGAGHGSIGAKGPLSASNVMFGVMVPWVLVPTITEASLFLTDMERRRVWICHFSESVGGVVSLWSVASWLLDDVGSVRVMAPEPAEAPNDAARLAVASVVQARRSGAYWSEGFTFDSAAVAARTLIGK